jgi:hypothetical protein
MADINVKLSAASEELGIFHDWEYYAPESNRGANADTETYKVTNKSGNSLSVRIKTYDGAYFDWTQEIEELEFTIHGAIEIGDFDDLHKLISKAYAVNAALSGRDHGVQEQG